MSYFPVPKVWHVLLHNPCVHYILQILHFCIICCFLCKYYSYQCTSKFCKLVNFCSQDFSISSSHFYCRISLPFSGRGLTLWVKMSPTRNGSFLIRYALFEQWLLTFISNTKHFKPILVSNCVKSTAIVYITQMILSLNMYSIGNNLN